MGRFKVGLYLAAWLTAGAVVAVLLLKGLLFLLAYFSILI